MEERRRDGGVGREEEGEEDRGGEREGRRGEEERTERGKGEERGIEMILKKYSARILLQYTHAYIKSDKNSLNKIQTNNDFYVVLERQYVELFSSKIQ